MIKNLSLFILFTFYSLSSFSQGDACATATPLTVNATCVFTTFTNAGATNSGVPDPLCANYAGGDVWFSVIVPASGSIIVDSNTGVVTDSGMALYSGACGGLTLIECDDDGSANGLMSSITRNGLTPGSTIYIRFWEYGNNNNGTFDICASEPLPAPSNDDCSNATALPCGTTNLSGTTIGTTNTANGTGCNLSDYGVWYTFTGDGDQTTISASGTGGFDIEVAIESGSCGSFTNLNCEDSGNPESYTFTTANGTDYYVYVAYWFTGGTDTGNFTISRTCNTVTPPPNDDCSGAITLTADYSCNYVTYTNAFASNSAGVPAPGCANYAGGDVWFSIIVPPSGELTIDTNTGVVTDGGMALYSGSCGALTLIECNDDGSTNGLMPLITQTGLTPGDTLYIRFWEYGNNNNGTFDICVSTTIPPGTNGVTICEGDPSEPLTSDITCATAGTTTLGNIITGNLNAATDPIAFQPEIFIQSTDPCMFDAFDTANYTTVNFQVTATGTYIFAMETPVPYFDGMGYIVVNDGNFVPGSCATGTWIAGDDDDGPNLDPQITAILTAGINYTLITTIYDFTSTTHTGSYTWNVSTTTTDVEWYTTATGGTAIGSGSIFDPVGVAGSGLADTNTAGTYTFWAGCPDGSPRTQADFVITTCNTCVMWTAGANSTDWYNPLNWSTSTVPTATDCVIIAPSGFDPILTYPGIPVPPTPGEALNLTVQNNATLEIVSDKFLTVTESVTVDLGGTFIIRPGGSLIQIDDLAVNSGEIQMQRSVSGLNPTDYVYWSSAVENFAVTGISPSTQNGFIWNWIPTVGGNGVGNYGEWQNTTEVMQLGKGYIVRGLSGTTVANTSEFIGRPNNGIINIPITRGTYTGADYAGAGNTFSTAIDDNWNLVGNPYPSAISANNFITDNTTTISGTVYLWRHLSAPSNVENDPFYGDYVYNYNPNDYIEYNNTGSNPPGFNGNIAAGQAFFVLMDDAATTPSNITFNNSMRSTTFSNNQFYRSSDSQANQDNNPINHHRIWLDLISSNNMATSILIGYVEGATNEIDRRYDGYQLNGSESMIRFYSLINENKFSIQGRTLPFTDEDTIPLGLVIPQNDIYKIAINQVDGLFENEAQNIYLEDTYTNTIHNLRTSPYSFTTETGTFDNRFVLRYNAEALSVNQFENNSDLIIYIENNLVKLKSEVNPIKSVIVYNVLGQTLIKVDNIDNLTHSLYNLRPSKGVLFVKAKLSDGREKIQKIIY